MTVAEIKIVSLSPHALFCILETSIKRGAIMFYLKLVRPALFVLICGILFSLNGQTATPTPKPVADDDVIKVDSRLVVVPVSVIDANGQPVSGLTVGDFRI